ncbi:hypothetical protein [Rickettsia endosymbiont of Culicoides newsteadi]|uniref:hypothetical protein n=1 Tax=Rickettsia endosymbiont of Culicoides newsteadi TaxID=1961830 RepID=UPI000B9A4655|nr:hypothetical protein [Rickettsia endosymbiont of Culicoides newsteadi]OZG31246.1 hypothetical protein RiCNE_13680 [Rickettsia endosymbiont of Culicoides newsteadi]
MSKSNFNPYAKMGSIKLCQTLKNITDVNNLKLAQDRAREIMWDQADGYKYGFNACGLSTIITIFSKRVFKPSVEFLEDWFYTAIRCIEEFIPQELANSIYAFGTLNIHPSKKFLEVWQREAVKQIGNFNNQNLANSIYALSKLYSNDLNNMDDNKQEVNEPSVNLVDEHSNASASEFYRTNSLDNSSRTLLIEFLEVWKIATTNKMNDFNAQESVNSLSGFCKLDTYLNKSLAKLADAQGVEGDASSQAAAHSSSSVCGDSSTASLSQLTSIRDKVII